jgi:ABC-2 type transport system ATP-binding protein
MKTAIWTQGLSKTYGAVKAVDQVDLAIPQGIIFGFLGPNGAGKTTTIRLLTGLARPTSGEGQVDEVSIRDGLNLARKIGYLPEEPAFYSWMSPMEYLDYIGRIFKIPGPERKKRIYELLDQLGLKADSKRRIGGFSRGMRQRLGLAQALINQPPVLMLDEPASALDPGGRKEVLELIINLRGIHTIFMSTHILTDAERVCDRIAIINQGKILIEASQPELRSEYSVPVYEIESAPQDQAKLSVWLDSLNTEPWVAKVSQEGTLGRITVSDPVKASQVLLTRIAASGISLVRYEIVQPTLEDIFIHLVSSEKE